MIRRGDGSFGEVNDTYLLPNTVVATMFASTLTGIRLMYFGVDVEHELGGRFAMMLDLGDTRYPPDFDAVIGDLSIPDPAPGQREPQASSTGSWREIATKLQVYQRTHHCGDHNRPMPTTLYGGVRIVFSSRACHSSYTVRLKFGSTP